jgi:hypothetical protein
MDLEDISSNIGNINIKELRNTRSFFKSWSDLCNNSKAAT